jgi:hypothetical protein
MGIRRLLPLRPILALALWGAAGLGARAHAAEVDFVRVWPGWHEADDFTRISEYFDDRENFNHREVRRSHPSDRAGFYFLTRVKHPAVSLMGARFVLRIITPTSPEAEQFTFPADVGPGENVFEIGLTGPDWAGRRIHPVAWRLELVTREGQTLAEAQSFLWAMPVGTPAR